MKMHDVVFSSSCSPSSASSPSATSGLKRCLMQSPKFFAPSLVAKVVDLKQLIFVLTTTMISRAALGKAPKVMTEKFVEVAEEMAFRLTMEALKGVLLDMFLGGTDTTTSAIEWTIIKVEDFDMRVVYDTLLRKKEKLYHFPTAPTRSR
ncbi:unnamed protein product [Linum trigynum]|uniref:Cytochrome P450 n=1 Tax=Linum trigynum TaxID=586398 RepID=A0AAV2EQU4_9ROSI